MSIKHLVRSLLVLLFLIGTCRVVQAQTRPTEDRAALWRAQKATEAIVDKNRAHLMEIPHVDHVSACVGPDREWAICVQVENHKYLSEVQRKIPSQIEGLPVRIEPRDQGWSL